jgi:twitching motility two-component system response regulator PilG
MKTILVLDDNKKLHRLVIDGLKAFGSVTTRKTKDLIVKSATDGMEAASVLSRFKVDLIVTDIEGPDSDGFQLMAYLKKSGLREIPVIAVTTANSPEVITMLEQVGVADYVKKPFVLLELLEKMLDVFDESSKALMSDFTVPNFLQALKMEKKTCTLKINAKGKVGQLHVENGELVDAETDALTGDRAAIEILGWENTKLKVEALSSNKKRIEGTIMHLLMLAAHAGEREADADPTSESVLDEVAMLAAGRHDKEARKKLTVFIKANMRNHEGWLWYSRVADKMEAIEKSLNNAKKIAPKDPEVLTEIQKIELAKKELKGKEFSRCPFCRAPLNVKVLECPYCRALLSIDKEWFSPAEDANQEILQEAVVRYASVVAWEANPDAYYYLGLAYLNLQQWEKGLDQLNKTVETFPDNEFYAGQLQMLMNLVTSSEDIFSQGTVEKEIGADLTPTTVGGRGKKKILVVESCPAIRKAIAITLSKRGHEVIEAEDGLEGLNRLDKTRPDVILMDVVLPKLDAKSVLSIIRDNSGLADIPVIVLTTNKRGLFKWGKNKLNGTTAFLHKPFDLSELIDTTEKYLV